MPYNTCETSKSVENATASGMILAIKNIRTIKSETLCIKINDILDMEQ